MGHLVAVLLIGLLSESMLLLRDDTSILVLHEVFLGQTSTGVLGISMPYLRAGTHCFHVVFCHFGVVVFYTKIFLLSRRRWAAIPFGENPRADGPYSNQTECPNRLEKPPSSGLVSACEVLPNLTQELTVFRKLL